MVDRPFPIDPPLAGLKVVEASELEPVQYAGRVLAQLGAEVLKLERPGGDPLRTRPPFAPDRDGRERSIPFEFFNAGKHSLVVDASSARSTSAAIAICEAADVVVGDRRSLPAFGLSRLVRRSEQVHVFVGSFGGALEDVVASSALTRLHASTSGYIIPADTDMTAPPGSPGPFIYEGVHGVGITVAILANGVLRSENRDPIRTDLAAWCAAHGVDHVLRRAAECDVSTGRVRRPSELVAWRQLHDRGFVNQEETAFGTYWVPGLPYGAGFSAVALGPAPSLAG